LASSPESRRLPCLFALFQKRSSSQQQLLTSDSDEEESANHFVIEGTNLFGSEHESTNRLGEGTNSYSEEADFEADLDCEQDGSHRSTPELSPQYCPQELPKCQAISRQNQDASFDRDTYLPEEKKAHVIEVVETNEVAKTNRQSKDSLSLLCTVIHLAAVGSASIQKVMKSLLLQSMIK
jgi:hypothetical protein